MSRSMHDEMMNDIETLDDIQAVVDAFYTGIDVDDLLGRYFAPIDMQAHLPRMYAFWSSVIFQTGAYRGRPFDKHVRLQNLDAAHFERWLERWVRTVDARFGGPNAHRMKSRAAQIAWVFSSRLCAAPIDESAIAAATQ